MKKTGILFVLMFICSVLLLSNLFSAEKENIIYIHDGSIDDTLFPMFVSTMDNVEVKGIVILDADCWADTACIAQKKLNKTIGYGDIPVAVSNAVAVHPFPDSYRNDCIALNLLPIINSPEDNTDQTLQNVRNSADKKDDTEDQGENLMVNILKNSEDGSVTICLLCASTPVANLLKKHPELEVKLKKIVWMGGSVSPEGGNVFTDKLYYCEWDMYWDPMSANWLLNNTKVPIILFPLEITNELPLYWYTGTNEIDPAARKFIKNLAENYNESLYCAIAHDGYNIVITENGVFYCLWSTITACYFSHPEYFHIQEFNVGVVDNCKGKDGLQNPMPDGHLYINNNGGRKIYAATKFSENVTSSTIYDYIVGQYKNAKK